MHRLIADANQSRDFPDTITGRQRAPYSSDLVRGHRRAADRLPATCARRGADIGAIGLHARQRSVSTTRGYVQDAARLNNPAARAVGL
jgi:hypothetical protein